MHRHLFCVFGFYEYKTSLTVRMAAPNAGRRTPIWGLGFTRLKGDLVSPPPLPYLYPICPPFASLVYPFLLLLRGADVSLAVESQMRLQEWNYYYIKLLHLGKCVADCIQKGSNPNQMTGRSSEFQLVNYLRNNFLIYIWNHPNKSLLFTIRITKHHSAKVIVLNGIERLG